jgi:glycerate 2-kinase
MSAALNAVNPTLAVQRHLTRQADTLIIGNLEFTLDHFRRVFIIGAGKASGAMARATAYILGNFLTAGIVITKYGHAEDIAGLGNPPNLQILEGGHPIPNQRGFSGTQQIMKMLNQTTPDDLVICLISGGGSALLCSPVSGLTLADIQKVTNLLLSTGATIHEINTLRKHLDAVKGGRLARLINPATIINLILSDVVGDDLDIIASGPTIPDSSTYSDALRILEHHDILDKVPQPVIAHLHKGISGEVPETPKPDDPAFKSTQNIIIGSNYLASRASVEQARKEGFQALLLTSFLQGEARHVGRVLAALLRQIDKTGEPLLRPACLIMGGETTVTLHGTGHGGRNQETALSAAIDLAGIDNVLLATLATDGGDGPTDAAGAIVTGQTLTQAARLGMSAEDYLQRNDSYHYFETLGDLIKTGPTQTNVNDLAFLFAY